MVNGNSSVLVANALEYERMMGLAYINGIYSQVLHNGHITIELLIKATYAKNNGGIHPYGHEIIKIAEMPLGPQIIPLTEIIKSDGLKEIFELIASAWSMQYRYEGRSTSQDDALMYLNAYKDAIKWIKSKYAQ